MQHTLQSDCILSIAICTYNRAFFLRTALESILSQTLSTEKFYVIVVNNKSTDATQAVISEMEPRFTNFISVYEPRQGLGHARNAAIVACRTPWLAFLDDDAKAHPDWISVILDVIKQNIFDCFGGVYLPWFHYGPPPKWFGEASATNRGTQPHMGLLETGKYPAGGNCVYRTELFERFGSFSTDFGMVGNTPAYGEETLLIKKFREGAARIGFVPHLIIDHCVLKYKYQWRWQLRAAFASGRDYARLCNDAISTKQFATLFLRLPYRITLNFYTLFKKWDKKLQTTPNIFFEFTYSTATLLGECAGYAQVYIKSLRHAS